MIKYFGTPVYLHLCELQISNNSNVDLSHNHRNHLPVEEMVADVVSFCQPRLKTGLTTSNFPKHSFVIGDMVRGYIL